MNNTTFNKQDAIKSSLENGIINIDKLLACNDFETIKEGLSNYPLTINEYLKNCYKDGDLRTIFQWSIDNDATMISNVVMEESDLASLSNYLKSRRFITNVKVISFDDLVDYEIALLKGKGKKFINDNYFYIKKDNDRYYSSDFIRMDKNKEQVADEIIKELSLKIDKKTLTAGLTKEYFEKLYNEKNYELLVIKLCVRLEAVLKCDFHYQGTFEEMLSQYSKEHGYEEVDDGYGYSSTVEKEENLIFHKLRKFRNDIVHAEKNQDPLSSEELESAIKYVISLG